MFEIKKSLEAASDWIISRIGSTVQNSIYGALILTIIILIIIGTIFEREKNLYKAFIKTGIYIATILLGYLVLHDKSLLHSIKANENNKKTSELFNDISKINTKEFDFNFDTNIGDGANLNM
ncbi:MAG: hypothetical protein KAS12_01550 [Candidatus Aenigmarchaeota archaeon]|nr:hypothetical protein [Candidatus Aenigmarchaeota archaeon]